MTPEGDPSSLYRGTGLGQRLRGREDAFFPCCGTQNRLSAPSGMINPDDKMKKVQSESFRRVVFIGM